MHNKTIPDRATLDTDAAPRITAGVACLVLFCTAVAVSQSVDHSPPQLAFEVASLKQSTSSRVDFRGGPNSSEPEHYVAIGVSLRSLMGRAYGLEDPMQQVSGPAWIDKQPYDVIAKIPPRITEVQFKEMLRQLLTDRFRMSIHIDHRDVTVCKLVIAKSGVKLKESAADLNTLPAGESPSGQRDEDGFLIIPPSVVGLYASYGPGHQAHWVAHGQSMAAFAIALRRPLATGRLVVDGTGLTGKYDFKFQYDVLSSTYREDSSDVPTLSIYDAIQKQLGLALIDAKMPLEVVIIDRAEQKPIEN